MCLCVRAFVHVGIFTISSGHNAYFLKTCKNHESPENREFMLKLKRLFCNYNSNIFFHRFENIVCLVLQYICENHFQRISNRSMFTGLRAVNHFGRPDMTSFLKFVQHQHSYVSNEALDSCSLKFLIPCFMTFFFPYSFILCKKMKIFFRYYFYPTHKDTCSPKL